MTLAEELNELLPAKWYVTFDPACVRLSIVKVFYLVRVLKYGEQYTVTMVTPNGFARSSLINRDQLTSYITHFTANVCVLAQLFGESPVIPDWAQETFAKQFASFVKDDTQ